MLRAIILQPIRYYKIKDCSNKASIRPFMQIEKRLFYNHSGCKMDYKNNGKFRENILVIEKTDCGKTKFVQKLGMHYFIADLKKGKMSFSIQI